MTDSKNENDDVTPADDSSSAPDAVTEPTASETEESVAAKESDETAASTENPAEAAASSENDDAPQDASVETGEADSESESSNDEDDLPDWEPLTPELVEDEAIRGDFMLRWAVVLLAFLLGCREISDTVTLVRIRTGEFLASNGFLPPATDVFSFTASDQPWVNLAWAFDLSSAGLFALGGAASLSLLTGFAAAATFFFLQKISRPETPTWWTAVCAGFALLTAHLQFRALPEIITLLGVAWTLSGLFKWTQTGNRSGLWCLVISLAVWSNLDPRAFIGWLIIALFTLGSFISEKLDRRQHHSDASVRDLGIATVAGLLALMLNPFGWQAVLSPFQLYGTNLPALAQYAGRLTTPEELQLAPLYSAEVWRGLNHHIGAALILVAATLVTCVMNIKRLDIGLFMAFSGLAGLSVLCTQELGVLVLAGTVLASLNGQDWYRTNCQQEYSIDTFEVLWSRAGRAITVLSFAAVAWLAISGRLTGVESRSVGIGFAPWFASVLDATADELESLPDGEIFTFRLDQSDLLLWHGVPTFVDSRVGVFTQGEKSILQTHNQARRALRRPARPSAPSTGGDTPPEPSEEEAEARRALWREPFDTWNVQLVTPRLWGTNPDYVSYFDLAIAPDWTQIGLGGTTAFFRRVEKPDSDEAVASRFSRGLFRKLAFEECRSVPESPARIDWPRPQSQYQKFLTLPDRPSSILTARAQHELAHLSATVQGGFPMDQADALGLALLCVRDAMAGAADDTDSSVPFRILADAYSILDGIEATVLAEYQLPVPSQQRYFQRVYSLQQALTIAPEDVRILASLADVYFSAGRPDLTFDVIERALAVLREQSEFDDATLQLARRLNQDKQQIAPQIETVESRLAEVQQTGNVDRLQLAAALQQQGMLHHALELLEEDRLMLAGNPGAELQLALLQAECGQLEEAASILTSLEQMGGGTGAPLAVTLQAAWLDMALGNFDSAIQKCASRALRLQAASVQALLGTTPLAMPSPQFLGDNNIWPASQTLVSSRVLGDSAAEVAVLQWTAAMAYLESGRCTESVAALHGLIDAFPESNFRPLVRVWLKVLTNEDIPEMAPRPDPGILYHDDSDMVVPIAEEEAIEETKPGSDSEPTPKGPTEN